ncbi:uncharacterized protein MONBRDRAFT_23731 [Monosiga brevicollis MX1]|uniref:CAP-Gly domain-containing protein n=1 Tax=Monosiga brevicollis TaxID=81824 RepID=A9UUA2_MONBE|nr:uncharacterized protein MONBRDRAFT_23731 [Monosiga brevicollis MX1]EDQ91631.1 predicted protein [Monosiga brevicollis MX1]|eukprot:XP_001744053.1 hypothetical protein [Monosiga brevicollis MX1]
MAQNEQITRRVRDIFVAYDRDGDGKLELLELQSALLSLPTALRLSQEDLDNLCKAIGLGNSEATIGIDHILANLCTHLVSTLGSRPEQKQAPWIEFYHPTEGPAFLHLVKGTVSLTTPDDFVLTRDDIVADAVLTHFAKRDTEGFGVIPVTILSVDLQTQELGLFLQANEVEAILAAHPAEPDGNTINYSSLAPAVCDYIMQLYAGRDAHPGHWARLHTHHHGTYWFNKMTGVTQTDVPVEVLTAAQGAPGGFIPNIVDEKLVAKLNEALQLSNNAVAAAASASGVAQQNASSASAGAEEIARHLAEIQQLRTTNAELQTRVTQLEDHISQLKAENTILSSQLAGKTQECDSLRQGQNKEQADMSGIIAERNQLRQDKAQLLQSHKAKAGNLEASLAQANETKKTLQSRVTELEAENKNLQQALAAASASVTAARDQLSTSESRLGTVNDLEADKAKLHKQLQDARALSEERQRQLAIARRQLKDFQAENVSMSKGQAHLSQTQQELEALQTAMETTKAFLATKTKLISNKQARIRELEDQVAQLEAQDKRRQKVLEDLVKRTASMHSRHDRGAHNELEELVYGDRARPASASPNPKAQAQDEVAKCSIKVGDRVTVPGPRGAVTASACSAVVKYVGRLDNDVPDYNLYIGVKLDDPISDTDGLFKGKRYFTCPDNHGHFCPVDDVLQVVSSRGKRKSTRRENGRS